MPDDALVDTIARAIADSDEYDGYWTELCDTIGNPQPGTDTAPPEACRAMYQREARAALAAMPQPIAYGILVHHYAPEYARLVGPMDRQDAATLIATEGDPDRAATIIVALVPVRTPQDAASGTNTTQPTPTDHPATTGPQNGTQGRELWQAWADGYLAAHDGNDETTNPFMVTCPTCGGHGTVGVFSGLLENSL